MLGGGSNFRGAAILSICCIAAVLILAEYETPGVVREEYDANRGAPPSDAHSPSKPAKAKPEPRKLAAQKARLAAQVKAQVAALKTAMHNEALAHAEMEQDSSAMQAAKARHEEPTNHWQSEAYARGSGVQGLGQRELQEESMAIEQARVSLDGSAGSTSQPRHYQPPYQQPYEQQYPQPQPYGQPQQEAGMVQQQMMQQQMMQQQQQQQMMQQQQQQMMQLLSLEHERLIIEKAKGKQVQRQAQAAIEAVKAEARHETKAAVGSIKEQAMQLMQTLSHKAEHPDPSSASTNPPEGTTALVAESLKEKAQALKLVESAQQEAAAARAAQAQLRNRLTQALIQQSALKGARQSQKKHIVRLEARLKQEEKTLAGKEPQLAASKALVTHLEAQRQKADKQALTMKSKLQEERSRREQAERAAAATVLQETKAAFRVQEPSARAADSPPVLTQTSLDAQAASDAQTGPALATGEKVKLDAVLEAVTAAKAAMLHAGELAHGARASAALAKTEAHMHP